MRNFNLITLIFIALSVLSCKDDDEVRTYKGKIQFQTTFGDDPVQANDYFSNGANEANITMAKFYLSNIRVQKSNGEIEQVQDYALLNLVPAFGENLNNSINVQLCECDYKAIMFNVGVDSETNALDPSTYPLDDVLSSSQNMYWNWNSGYVFYKFEGTANNAGQSTEQWYVHTGLDKFYIPELKVNRNFKPTTENFIVGIDLDVNTLVNGGEYYIDLTDRAFSHTMDNEELSRQMTENLSEAFK